MPSTTVAQPLDHWIGGESVAPASGSYFEDLNPADDTLYARAAEGTAEDVNRAVEAAHAAFASYRQTLPKQREAWLNRAADLIEAQRQEFLDILIDEVGSPMMKAGFEIAFAPTMLRAAAGVPRRLTGETIPSDTPGRISLSVREPVGVIAGITPFNVPLIKAMKQAAMALATGNTFVLLPSEHAPHLAHRVAKLFADAGFPDGSFNVVTGNGAVIGDHLTGHPLVKAVTFTGSSVVGRHIAELCGRNLKKCVLELGGKSPLVVFKDADLEAAVRAAAMGTFFYQGQACMASSRILVERPVLEQFGEMLGRAAGGMQGGDLREPSTVLGPIISERQRERVRRHIEDAVDKGARVIAGASWDGPRCAPTVLTDVRPEMTLYYEETFGPVTSLYPFDSQAEAVAQANDSEYGLSAAVFTSNVNTAIEMARAIHTGMVHINAPSLYDEPHVPFGGVGSSGLGREGTEADLDTMTEWKWITVQLPGYAPAH